MNAHDNAETAEDGHDARNRNDKTGKPNAWRGRIRDLLMGKMAEPGYDENQRIE